MKICYLSYEGHIHSERWMKWFANSGHEVHLITINPRSLPKITIHSIKTEEDRRPRYKRYWQLGFNLLWVTVIKNIFRVRKILSEVKPDILHLHTLSYPSILGVFTGFHPFLVSPWNGDITWQAERHFIHNLAAWYAIKCADGVTADCQQMVEIYQEKYRIPEKKIHFIQIAGVDLKSFRPGLPVVELRQELNLGNSPVVISTRSLPKLYNIDIIVRAIPLVLKEVPETKFIFIWHFAKEAELQMIISLIKELGVGEAVMLLGKREHHELPYYLNLADVFVSIASLDSTPTSLLEGMACGVPPVTADLPAVNEYVRDGWNGFVVPQRDYQTTAQAIIRLLNKIALREIFRKRNLELVRERGDYEVAMRKTEELYLSLREAKGGRLK